MSLCQISNLVQVGVYPCQYCSRKLKMFKKKTIEDPSQNGLKVQQDALSRLRSSVFIRQSLRQVNKIVKMVVIVVKVKI